MLGKAKGTDALIHGYITKDPQIILVVLCFCYVSHKDLVMADPEAITQQFIHVVRRILACALASYLFTAVISSR